MRLPDFFVVGAPKSGTTSLYNYLGHHDQIFTPSIKEPHFFACPEVKDAYYDVPYVDNLVEYAELFESAQGTQEAGDFSTSYLHYEKAAHRIKQHCPESRILMVLRDPVERAVSHYLMDVRDGYQSHSLMECLKEKEELYPYYREYVKVGFYSEQVKRYRSLFDANNIKILLFEEFKNNTKSVLRDISHFIKVDEPKKWNISEKHNKHHKPINPFIGKVLKHRYIKKIYPVIPETLRKATKKIVFTTKKPELKKERRKLRKIFYEDISQLQSIIKKDISSWLS